MEGAFIHVRHAYVSYKPQGGFKTLLGKKKAAISALSDISFSLEEGSHTVIFGAGASGKTTLLKLLAGTIVPDTGSVTVCGKRPDAKTANVSGYVSLEREEGMDDTVYAMLHEFGTAHDKHHLPSRIGEIANMLGIHSILHRNMRELSVTEYLKTGIVRAALSSAPIILLDDVADILGAEDTKGILRTIFPGKTVCVTARNVQIAEDLDLPILLLHKSSMVHSGTRDAIAHEAGVARIVDAWVEGMRYDMLRKLRTHPGVMEVRLMPTDQFEGTRVRITLRNSRYLPSLYNLMSTAPLVSIEELPPSLAEILETIL